MSSVAARTVSPHPGRRIQDPPRRVGLTDGSGMHEFLAEDQQVLEDIADWMVTVSAIARPSRPATAVGVPAVGAKGVGTLRLGQPARPRPADGVPDRPPPLPGLRRRRPHPGRHHRGRRAVGGGGLRRHRARGRRRRRRRAGSRCGGCATWSATPRVARRVRQRRVDRQPQRARGRAPRPAGAGGGPPGVIVASASAHSSVRAAAAIMGCRSWSPGPPTRR